MPDLYAAIVAEVDRRLTRAAVHLTGKVKEVLSVPAPRRAVIGKRGKLTGVRYYVATTPATPGAPPRKLSGRLRSSITWESISEVHKRVGTNVLYGKPLENMGHLFLGITMNAEKATLERIIGG